MFSTTLKKALVVASVSLALPVLGATSAFAEGPAKGNGGAHANENSAHGSKDSAAAPTASGHGKGSKTDTSGSSTNPDGTFQGKSSSTPDQDGTGTDGRDDESSNNDKTGPGTDGNNGCGNEPRTAAPRDGGRPTDDDNNGWCGSKPKPERKAKPATTPVTAAAPVVAPQAAPAPKAAPVAVAPQGVQVVAPRSTTRTVVVAAPVQEAVASRAVAARNVPVAGAAVLGSGAAAVMGPPTGLGTGTVTAQSAVAPQALPFTGAPVGLLALLAAAAVVGGATLTIAARRS